MQNHTKITINRLTCNSLHSQRCFGIAFVSALGFMTGVPGAQRRAGCVGYVAGVGSHVDRGSILTTFVLHCWMECSGSETCTGGRKMYAVVDSSVVSVATLVHYPHF